MLHQHCMMDLLVSPPRYLLDCSSSKFINMKLVLATLIYSSPILNKNVLLSNKNFLWGTKGTPTFNFVVISLLESFRNTIRKSASTRLSISSAPWTAGMYPRSLWDVPKPINPGTVPRSLARSSAARPLLEGWQKNRDLSQLPISVTLFCTHHAFEIMILFILYH